MWATNSSQKSWVKRIRLYCRGNILCTRSFCLKWLSSQYWFQLDKISPYDILTGFTSPNLVRFALLSYTNPHPPIHPSSPTKSDMAIYGAEDRFCALGMKPPDLSFLEKPVPPSQKWGAEPLYNPTALVGNWYEDRRAYMRLCPRFTGQTITKTDYVPWCHTTSDVVPPRVYAQKMRDKGPTDPDILKNTEDYCDYLRNYTTTSDLMHNWEVRRAGCKAKPWRKWKLVMDATWFPERDNAVSFGNLTQLGYRKAPQVPLLPNDWDVYANNPTSHQVEFPPPRYPDHYVHCRRAASKQIRRENEDMMLIRAPDPCSKCKVEPCTTDCSCACICHAIEHALKYPKKRTPMQLPHNTPRFGKFIPAVRLKQKPGLQNLHSTDAIFPYRSLKYPPHLPAQPCKPDCLAFTGRKETSPFQKPDICTDYAGDIRRE